MSANPDLGQALRFLDDLSQNNSKAWFDQNRSAYEAARGNFCSLLKRSSWR
ncbi:MAG: DUF2461 family protein [Anaerolineales bacterium]|nr:DUF2461 family protein [Anaerolineales bacterium]